MSVNIPGAKPRAILTMLGLHNGSVVSADTLVELLWGEDPPRTAAKALQTHISSLRRTLGDGFILTQGAGWTLAESEVDVSRYKAAARLGRDAAAAGDTSQAVARFEEALALWRGIPELPDGRRGTSEKTRWVEGHAALVEDRADALLATGRAAEIIGELEAAVADAPLRERRWGQLMLALYRAGRQGEALGAYQRARALLADELGVDPGPDLRRLEAAIVAQDISLEIPAAQQPSVITRAVTFLLTDVEGSTAAWEAEADAMAVALARHDELVEQVVTSRGGRLIKTRGEGDATFSVFERPSAAASAAIELQEAIVHEPWALREPMRIRVALHTGEAELRDGDYFGRAVNRAARLRSLAAGGQILCSGATAELVIDSLADDVVLADLGMRELRNLARPEHVFELRLETPDDRPPPVPTDVPVKRPSLPAVLAGPGPFVGRGRELERLFTAWQAALAGGTNAVLIAGEPGVGKTRLAGEWSRQAYDQGALVIYGRCDEDLGAPYQPFAEALRSLVPCLGSGVLRGLRGVEALLALVPGLSDVLPDLAMPTRADPDTERYALFDAVVALLGIASAGAPIILILDDLHWAAKPTLLLLRHLLRFGEHARVQIVATYRSTDLDRSHPLAAMLADLHRDGTADRLQLGGLDEDDVSTYVAEAGYDDEELARALASVTGGNPFFLIEALRHVDESGGRWDQSTLPQGVREAVSRRLSRLAPETNKALAAAAVVGSRFALELVERVVGDDLVDALDEACKAGIVIEEPGGRYRFNHALIRQSLLAELPSVRRMRLHQRIATTLESEPGADDELLAELAHHYFECAWAGNAVKAVEYCRRAADQAIARLSYEGAADLYDRALHALEEIDDELPDRDDQTAELLIARCEALLAAGDVASAAGAVSQLQGATVDSARLAAWATCFDGQLSMLTHPERLDEVEAALGAAATKLAELDDAAGEATAHTVRAGCLARLGRIGDCEVALDDALTAARRAHEHRRVNAVLAMAPLAALWGPNPVPRAGGRCLDVVRLLRITTDSPAVEATSTRCQAVLEAFRGRAAAARRMIDSARRTVTELGLRHALLEVEQFAGIVELVIDEPAAAVPHLRKAYNGFRRMGLDADTAETAALLGGACLALDRAAEAEDLCAESERLAGHALKPSIAWRTLRARLLSLAKDHDAARRVAEEAVSLAERTDALVDHGDACASLATVLGAASDVAASRAAAERAADLYERKGAAALAEKTRRILGAEPPPAPAPPEAPRVELDNACVRAVRQLDAAYDREAWEEIEQLVAAVVSCDSHRKIVGLSLGDLPYSEWECEARRYREMLAEVRYRHVVLAVRGERLALTRLEVGPADLSPGAPRDELLQLYGIDEEGRIALQVWFDLEDMDAAVAELDALHARFEEERPRSPLENTATRIYERLHAFFAARDWDAISELLTDDYYGDDRRSVVGAGIRRGPDSAIEDYRSAADIEVTEATSDAIATRGARLALARARYSRNGQEPEGFHVDFLQIVEIDDDERIAAMAAFDLDDFDTAIAELDARYLAGEAAAHAHTWSAIARAYAAIRQHELGPMTPDFVNIDHRRGAAYAPGELIAYVRAGWDLGQDISTYVEAVNRLDDSGAVVTHVGNGTSREGFEAEWRGLQLLTVDGDMVSRSELFDEADLETAITRFEQLSRPAQRQPENAASRVYERFKVCYAARDWAAVRELFADNILSEDRRNPINSGVRQGPDALVAEISSIAEVGIDITTSALATRGEHLVLSRIDALGRDQGADGYQVVALDVLELDADERFVARMLFNLDDFDAAIAELDARYLAGEAAPHAQTWSVIAASYAAINRHEEPPTTPDWVNVDHRREIAMGPDDLVAYISAGLDSDQDITTYVETVHRLNVGGAVVTYAAQETSREGFNAEWRGVVVLLVDGDKVSRSELFDETDLDAALARFDELSRPTLRLENTATRVFERLYSYFAAGDWQAAVQLTAENVSVDDRRRVVSAGIRHGRDVNIKDAQATVDVGFTMTIVGALATRGERLALLRVRVSGSDPGTIQDDALNIVEIDADELIAADVVFELDDIDAAFEELEARYLAGEAADHAHTWSVIAKGYATLNRRELPSTPPDYVNIDHRRGAPFPPGELMAYVRAGWDVDPDIRTYAQVVHRLSDVGAVDTHAAYWTSPEGFVAEWRGVDLMTVDGDMVNHTEVFDEADLDVALAKFDELSRPAPQLENAASQAYGRFRRYFAARDWAAMAELLTADTSVDDHRRVVNAEIRRGRDVEIANMQAFAEIGATSSTATVIATRGERLVLCRTCISGEEQQPGAFNIEFLNLVEITADQRIAARSAFDLDDIDAAFEELDARYLTGEAAAHAQTWSVIAGAFAAINRHELPELAPDWIDIDHRRGAAFASGEMTAYIHDLFDNEPDFNSYITVVHRLSDLGAVVTMASHGTSQQGFQAEWREIGIFTFDGDLLNRCELFDEADLDAATARFEELHPQTPRLENSASQVTERLLAHFASGDWDAIPGFLGDDFLNHDRRRVVGAGVHHGRDAQIADMRAIANLGITDVTPTEIATRGGNLVLSRLRFSVPDQVREEFLIEALCIIEVKDGQIVAFISFDVDDIDAAFEELDARYIAGEAAPYASVWKRALDILGEVNRHEPGPMIDRLAFTDHRRVPFADGDFRRAIEELWPLVPDARYRATAVHALDVHGVVASLVIEGTDAQGNELQWARTLLLDPDEPRLEIYEESDLDRALARFEQLNRPAPRLENAASEVYDRLNAYFARDWDAIAKLMDEDFSIDDRRRVVGEGVPRGRDAQIANMRASAELGFTNVTSTVIATRGRRLILARACCSGSDQGVEGALVEVLCVVEINDVNRIAAMVVFDPDDIIAAVTELDARYVAGEAAACAQTWSVIMQACAALNRREIFATTADFVDIDHRPLAAIGAGDLKTYMRAALNDGAYNVYVEAVHRLSKPGAVVTLVSNGTSQEGFEGEWRMADVFTVEGDLISRCEIFDEADLDVAVARFEGMQPPTRRLENAASRADDRFFAHTRARDWAAAAELLSDNSFVGDRRRVVNIGVWEGRDVVIANLRALADALADVTSSVIAIRGNRLALTRISAPNRNLEHGDFRVEMLCVVELDADDQIAAHVMFDPDEMDAAFTELEARYLAGEAGDHSHTWSVVTGSYGMLNRRELPPRPDFIDHRRGISVAPDDLTAFIGAAWELERDIRNRIENVHRMNKFGAVVTRVSNGTSQEGLEAEWRSIDVLTVDGDVVNRCEVFDEADLDAALARFEELDRPAPTA